jgi:hypothetical protein
MIIDSQVHAYEAKTVKRPWHSVPNWPDQITGDEMVAAIQPRQPPAPPQPWADLPKVLELAKRPKPPNAAIRVSGACTLSRKPSPFAEIWDQLARVFDA